MLRICYHQWLLVILVVFMTISLFAKEDSNNPKVILETSMGEIELELYTDKAPISVENFLSYVKSGFYNKTIFHRVIDRFMIQGGGFDTNHKEKAGKKPPIKNEATAGLKNKRGTIAYARTNVVNSATSQFFINYVNNPSLDHKDKTAQGFGYAVFGKVIRGMKVVDAIAKVKTGSRELSILYKGQIYQQNSQDVPLKPVVLLSARLVEEEEASKE